MDASIKTTISPRPGRSEGLSRRGFLMVGGGAAAGLVLGFVAPGGTAARAGTAASAEGAAITPFLRIAPDDTVTVISKHLEFGQGPYTGLATLVAEELDADWAQIRAESAPSDPTLYNNLSWGPYQGTGGSSAIFNAYEQYRTAGATARALLVAAAAADWGVPAVEIDVSAGRLSHASGRSAGFGVFAAAAVALPAPEAVELKAPADFKLIGNPDLRRLDSVAKTDGSALYTMDVQRPGMLVAVLARPPKFGATVKSFDAADALALPGVVEVVAVPRGVAVLGETTWAALQGRAVLTVDWDESAAETRGSAELEAEYRDLLLKPGLTARADGDAEAAMASAATIKEMDFAFPFLAHAPMEPVNAVAELVPGQSLEVWTGSQLQTVDTMTAAAIAGLEPAQVQVHTLLAGGSFGRRATPDADMVAEAVSVAVAIERRAPVKLVWSREDDIKGGRYRPLYLHRVRAGLDAEGRTVAWQQRIVGQSILAGTPFAGMIQEGLDPMSVEGASNLPYAIPNLTVDLHSPPVGVPVLWWRAVGSTHTAYAVETMVDALAAAAGADPVDFRLALLDGHPRHAAVLRLAAEKAGWGSPLPEGVYRGVALHESFRSYVAQVAEVRLNPDGTLAKVERVVCAVDCGVAVNPDQVKAQMEGGIGYGLGAILRNQITLSGGAVEQEQFYDYLPLRIGDMPDIEVHIVDSDAPPTGVGEPGTPVIGPAVANAIFAATGTHPTELPFTRAGTVG